MASSTNVLRTRGSSQMLRMIELHIETFIEVRWEVFERRIAAARVRMTNRTHGNGRRGELSEMTTRARFVSWKARRN